jgi:MFS family permease
LLVTQMPESAGAPGGVLSRPYRPAAVAIFTTAALSAFEGMAVAAALPQVAADLGNVALLPWVITSYLLASSITTVISGPFVDGVGVARIFRLAVVVFTVSGTAAAFAPTMPVMIALRLVQGAAGGLLISSGLAAVALVYPQELVGRAYAGNATVWGVMSVAGPALAAAMLTYLDWRWIFLINLPLGAVSLLAGWRTLPGPADEAPVTIDAVGAMLVAGLTTVLLLALDAIGILTAVWLVVGLALGGLYHRHARSHPSPVVRLEHLITQPYRNLGLGTGLMLAGAMTISSYVPLYVQAGRNGSTAMTAWSVLFLSMAWTIGAIIGSRLLDRMSESAVCVLGFGFTTPGLAALAIAARYEADLAVVFALLSVIGLGIGLTTNAGLTLVRAVTDSASMGRAGSVYQFSRSQGIAAGTALGGAVMLLVIDRRLGDVEAVRELLTGTSTEALGRDVNLAVQAGFSTAAITGTVAAAVGAVLMVRMRGFLADVRHLRRGQPVTRRWIGPTMR